MPEASFEWRGKVWTIKGSGPGMRRRLAGHVRQQYMEQVSRMAAMLGAEQASRLLRDAAADLLGGAGEPGTDLLRKYLDSPKGTVAMVWAAVSVAHPEFTFADAEAVRSEAPDEVASAMHAAFPPDPTSAAPGG